MIKKIVMTLLCAFLLTGCKFSDYKRAVKYYENNEFENAIISFETLGDYKDSNKYLLSAIEKQAIYYEKELKFEEAIELLETYPYLENNDEEIERLENECKFQRGIEMLNSLQPQKAMEIFRSLPKEYKSTLKILNDYEKGKNWSGYYSSYYEQEPITGFWFQSTLIITFSYCQETGGLQLDIQKRMYDKDSSSAVLNKIFSVPISDIGYMAKLGRVGYVAKYDKYEWWLSDDKKITEIQRANRTSITQYDFEDGILILE